MFLTKLATIIQFTLKKIIDILVVRTQWILIEIRNVGDFSFCLNPNLLTEYCLFMLDLTSDRKKLIEKRGFLGLIWLAVA